MTAPPLHWDDEARVIAALVALDWMEFPFETSSRTVARLLGCLLSEATAIWKTLRERQIIELKSRFDSKLPGKPIRSAWKWRARPTPCHEPKVSQTPTEHRA